MTAENPGWLPDPSGRHQYRFWNGTQWTEFVGDGGVQSTDPPPDDLANPEAAAPQPRAKQWAPDSIWEGERKSLSSAATKGRMVSARYRITNEYIYFDAGLISSRSEQVPLWAVRDVDIKQSMTQKARSVGDVIVRVQHDDYTGRPQVVLESIDDPRGVRDLINSHAQPARLEHQKRGQTHFYQGQIPTPGPASTVGQQSAPPPGDTGKSDVISQLKELAKLRDDEILTDEEFQIQKRKLLDG